MVFPKKHDLADALIIVHPEKYVFDRNLEDAIRYASLYAAANKPIYQLDYSPDMCDFGIEGIIHIRYKDDNNVTDQVVVLKEQLMALGIQNVEEFGMLRRLCVEHIRRNLSSSDIGKEYYRDFAERAERLKGYRVQVTIVENLCR